MLDRNDAFFRSKMGQQRRRHHITDRVNTLFRSLLILVDQYETLFNFDLRAFETQTLRVRHAPDSYQQHLRFESNRLTLRCMPANPHARFSLLQLVELRVDLRLDPALAKTPLELLRNLFILEGHEPR